MRAAFARFPRIRWLKKKQVRLRFDVRIAKLFVGRPDNLEGVRIHLRWIFTHEAEISALDLPERGATLET
jgi:hypothetical protein